MKLKQLVLSILILSLLSGCSPQTSNEIATMNNTEIQRKEEVELTDDSTYSDKEWVIEAADIEIKNKLYTNYEEIPKLDTEIVYESDNEYIAVVRFQLKELGFDGSYACHVIGSEDYPFVCDMTGEMEYGFDYESKLEELKILFRLK